MRWTMPCSRIDRKILALDATTTKALTVDAVAILGGVRGIITATGASPEYSVVLRNVPFGTATPPSQPCTVTAPGYVTFADQIQISLTVATFFTATFLTAVFLMTTGAVFAA